MENHECRSNWTIRQINALAEKCNGFARFIIPGRQEYFREGAPPLKPYRTNHDQYDNYFPCPNCNDVYERKSQLKEHLKERECSYYYPLRFAMSLVSRVRIRKTQWFGSTSRATKMSDRLCKSVDDRPGPESQKKVGRTRRTAENGDGWTSASSWRKKTRKIASQHKRPLRWWVPVVVRSRASAPWSYISVGRLSYIGSWSYEKIVGFHPHSQAKLVSEMLLLMVEALIAFGRLHMWFAVPCPNSLLQTPEKWFSMLALTRTVLTIRREPPVPM